MNSKEAEEIKNLLKELHLREKVDFFNGDKKEIFSRLASMDSTLVALKELISKLPCTTHDNKIEKHTDKIEKLSVRIESGKLATLGVLLSIIISFGTAVVAGIALFRMSATIAGVQ